MKKSFLLLTVGALLVCPILTHAQDTSGTTPPPGGPGGHHGPPDFAFLTDAQKAELEKARQEALAANPNLAKEEQDLKAAHDSGTPPTEEQKEQFKQFREQMDQAMIATDPNVAPILQEIKEHMGHHHHGGPGGPPPAGTGTGGPSGA